MTYGAWELHLLCSFFSAKHIYHRPLASFLDSFADFFILGNSICIPRSLFLLFLFSPQKAKLARFLYINSANNICTPRSLFWFLPFSLPREPDLVQFYILIQQIAYVHLVRFFFFVSSQKARPHPFLYINSTNSLPYHIIPPNFISLPASTPSLFFSPAKTFTLLLFKNPISLLQGNTLREK